jgi:uncharacterized membrane protein YphA (DoxX/SURF4 family)
MFVVTLILAIVLALAFGASGVGKLTGAKMAVDTAGQLNIAFSRYRLIGVPEVLAAIGLLVGLAVWPLGVAAAAGLVVLMIGAVIAHVRAHDKLANSAPATVLGLLSLVELILRALTS